MCQSDSYVAFEAFAQFININFGFKLEARCFGIRIELYAYAVRCGPELLYRKRLTIKTGKFNIPTAGICFIEHKIQSFGLVVDLWHDGGFYGQFKFWICLIVTVHGHIFSI